LKKALAFFALVFSVEALLLYAVFVTVSGDREQSLRWAVGSSAILSLFTTGSFVHGARRIEEEKRRTGSTPAPLALSWRQVVAIMTCAAISLAAGIMVGIGVHDGHDDRSVIGWALLASAGGLAAFGIVRGNRPRDPSR
jgi:hypothetical protein